MTRLPPNWFASVILAFALALPSPGFATGGEEEAKEGKTAHYKVPLPRTKEEAVAVLQSSMSKIESALGKSDLHAIHEESYTTESAVKRISLEPGYDGLKETLMPRVEIVHLASELGDAETLKAAVPALSKAVKEQLQALSK